MEQHFFISPGWEAEKAAKRSRHRASSAASWPLQRLLSLISRLLQELQAVHWLPTGTSRCYNFVELKRALAHMKSNADGLLHRFLSLCTSILELVSLSPSGTGALARGRRGHLQRGGEERPEGLRL